MPILLPGVRVVRGPSWKYGNQDGGEGYLGTVTEIANNEVIVQWDVGFKSSYSLDKELRIYDTATVGIKHAFITCDGCSEENIKGFRWKCAVCDDFDLCSSCYFKGKHDLRHNFSRILDSFGDRCNVGIRNGASCKTAHGFFPNAVVKRGPDWKWGNQDGGNGQTGKILSLYDWKETTLSDGKGTGAKVSWNSSNVRAEYRVCFKGQVDLTVVRPGSGGNYYDQHLPVLDESCLASATDTNFSVGDAACVAVDWQTMRALQNGHGGVNDSMRQTIGRIGKVSKVLASGDIGIEYKLGGGNLLAMLLQGGQRTIEWVFNPNCLKKVETFSPGEKVLVMSDKEIVEKMQEGHGGWADGMTGSLGKVGKVMLVDKDGDIRTQVGGPVWTFSPAALKKVPASTEVSGDSEDKLSDLLMETLVQRMLGISVDRSGLSDEVILAAALNGDKAMVESMLKGKKALATYSHEGRTALHLACHKGHVEVAELLLRNGADVNQMDNDGDTALHFASHGSEISAVRLLVNNRVSVDLQNSKGLTALHISAHKGDSEIVHLLAVKNADVNLQDVCGDTPLHDAIAQERVDVFEVLVNLALLDFTIVNKRGFNPLHHAVLKGKEIFVKKILDKVPELVNVQKEDGFGPLHLAVINGHEDIVNLILQKGHCLVEQKTAKGQTPFMLAAQESYMAFMKVLIAHGASINSEDEDGDTALHAVLKKYQLVSAIAGQLVGVESTPDITEILSQFDRPKASGIAIACFLVREGADLYYCNHEGKTALDIIEEPSLKSVIWHFREKQSQFAAVQVPQRPPRNAPPPDERPPQAASPPSAEEVACKDCKEQVVDTQLIPCGHKLFCYSCAENYRKCRECKVNISEIKQFLPASMPTCRVCENACNIRLLPCNHTVVCHVCAKRLTKCLECNAVVVEKKLIGPQPDDMPADEDDGDNPNTCNICLTAPRDCVFLCGHGCCETCAHQLRECHMCRERITKIIKLFN